MKKFSKGFVVKLLSASVGLGLAMETIALQDPPLLSIQRPLLEGRKETPGLPGTATLNLTVDYTESQIWNPSTKQHDRVKLRSYRGDAVDPKSPYVAPTLKVFPGETIRVTLDNQLPPDHTCTEYDGDVNKPHCFNGTNLHAHGLWISPAGNSDNVLISINPQVAFEYEYNIPADHPAGTFWYHPHRHGSTAIQVASGMGGALIVQGNRQPTLERSGDIDVLLGNSAKERLFVFQQIQYACYTKGQPPAIKRNSDQTYLCESEDVGIIENIDDFGPNKWATSGRHTSINGVVQPVIKDAKVGELERWRMIHAGVRDSINFKVVKMTGESQLTSVAAAAEKDFLQQSCAGAVVPQYRIAADGLTLAAVDTSDVSVFQPGYRWDTLMLFSEPGRYCVIDEAAAASANVGAVPSEPRLLGFVDVKAGRSTTIKDKLIDSAKNITDRSIRRAVADDLKNGLGLENFVPHSSLLEMSDKEVTTQTLEFNIDSGKFMIDNSPFDPNRVDRQLILGNTDDWTLTSKVGSHPFHIHVNPFQIVKILDPNGKDVSAADAIDDYDTAKQFPDPQYRGMKGKWKDTIWVKNAGGKTYTVVVRTKYQRYIGDFVLHCHILDHEDQGMMQNVRISIPDGKGGVSKGHH
ncbi:MAG: multicopper oxidase domain-containing protein [Cellvibrionaceae bacterium]|nr:multicopper oxidase domain-containing protein [Cellvibrionaceae bacterium]